MSTFFLEDKRVECLSGIGQLDVKEYLGIVGQVYKQNGGISGQRAPLKTKTGITIRNRMVDDVKRGAILPPVVLGAVVSPEVFDKARNCTTNEEFSTLVRGIDPSTLSVIDGMQRTTALYTAMQDKNNQEINKTIRVDFWLAKNIQSLIYRMLVLNTGQVPWDIKRQLETIYKQVLIEIKSQVSNIDVFNIDEQERRSGAGQYRATRIVELFLAFTSRKPHIEIKEKVAEDFARMEATEATANEKSLPAFIETMKLLATLDRALATTQATEGSLFENARFKEGKDIFTSAPASIGFSAAAAQYLFGMPGYELDFTNFDEKLSVLQERVNKVSAQIKRLGPDFVDYLTLNEKISAKHGRIGEFERDFFLRAFSHMFNHSDLPKMTPCWFAY